MILRKAKTAYEFSENKEKNNHLIFMDDLKLYIRSEKGLDTLVQSGPVFSEDIGWNLVQKMKKWRMERL